jgi:hypothetical protein
MTSDVYMEPDSYSKEVGESHGHTNDLNELKAVHLYQTHLVFSIYIYLHGYISPCLYCSA